MNEGGNTHAQPFYPKLRGLDVRWIDHQGQPHLYLRDPLGLSDKQMLIPAPLVAMLALCDGTRDTAGLRVGLELRTGLRLSLSRVEALVGQLDEALFLDGPRFEEACAQVLRAYRDAPFRQPTLAGVVYPGDSRELAKALAGYNTGAGAGPLAGDAAGTLAGVVSPHIDYQRGGPVYAAVWQKAAQAARDAEMVVVFGTDHAGGPGQVTLTRQSYATPWGVLPTDQAVVDAVAEAIGPERAFAEELHHAREHSVELAVVWLHYVRQGQPCPLVPVLCGSFQPYTSGERVAERDGTLEGALAALCQAIAGRRALVVAAGDLAHVGPTFGDSLPLDLAARAQLRADDHHLLDTLASGDAALFLDTLRQEGDRRRVCGLPPIYLALRALGASRGEVTSYDQCPADPEGGSLVSVAGVLLQRAESTT